MQPETPTTGALRNWCWTLNNYTDEEEAYINELYLKPEVAYICYGKEVGEKGTPHLQGYVELMRPVRGAGLKKLLSQR